MNILDNAVMDSYDTFCLWLWYYFTSHLVVLIGGILIILIYRKRSSFGTIFQGNVNLNAESVHFGVGNILAGAIRRQLLRKDRNVEQLWNILREELKKHSLSICGEPDFFRGKDVEFVEMQIAIDDLPKVEKVHQKYGHYQQRYEMIQHFDAQPLGNISYTQLFEEVKCRAKKKSQKRTTPEAAKEFLLTHGNLVFLSGQPGTGKSTIAKRLAKEMWESFYEEQHFILFLIRFRDFEGYNDKREIDLLHFLAPFVIKLKLSTTERQEILKKIDENSEHVYIILDGLDETSHIQITKPFERLYDIVETSTNFERFVQNLVAGKILQKSKKLITSRPYQFATLPRELQPKILCTIQGLDDAGIEHMCKNLCRKNILTQANVWNHLKTFSDFKSYCHTPAVCILIIKQLKKLYEENQIDSNNRKIKIRPSMTSIFVRSIFGKWLSAKPKGSSNFLVKKVSLLAFEGISEGRFYFPVSELKRAGVDFEQNSCFLTEILDKAVVGRTVYFVHLLFQEFLAAVKLRLYTDITELRSFISECDWKKYEMVLVFLFGLCNDRNLNPLLDHLEMENQNDKNIRNECKKELGNFAWQKLKKFGENEEKGFYDPYLFHILPVLRWVCEMDDVNITKQAAACLRDEFKVHGQVIPDDVRSINHFLRARAEKLDLKVFQLRFIAGCCQNFFQEISSTLTKNANVQMKELVLENVLVDDDLFQFILSHCICEVESFGLQGCNVSTTNAVKLFHDLKERKKAMKELWLNNMPLYDNMLSFILSDHCINEIEKLNLEGCNITNQIVAQLVNRLTQRKGKVQMLDLSGNEKIDDNGAMLLRGCLVKLQKLSLVACNISDKMQADLEIDGEEVGCKVVVF